MTRAGPDFGRAAAEKVAALADRIEDRPRQMLGEQEADVCLEGQPSSPL
jgi:hypothetical protein